MQWLRIQGLPYVHTAEQEEMTKVRKEAPYSRLFPFVILECFVCIYLPMCGSSHARTVPKLNPNCTKNLNQPKNRSAARSGTASLIVEDVQSST